MNEVGLPYETIVLTPGQVVLAFGKIVNANETSYPDLYRSLKGGSNNFGVVTRFDMETFEQGPFWGGEVIYPLETRQQHLAAFEQLNGATTYDQYAALIHNYVYTTEAGWAIINLYQYTKRSAESVPRAFQPFTNIQPQVFSNLRVAPLANFTNANEQQGNGNR
jgi:hypothetical protein